ncbi:endonuclease/exonuclease/phosphatase family protein [Roseovarius rhodophyticola]|uniref:Endonuclease/exonuclease/phosphatase family protein n=1 Tax=Roseovarius rhodophyticola TaxID=3080827 RepID=A0ABZ2TJV6_9RHOB|nr:endonuclease/exonuclease/phosphatase family protein [Roseovarius sp. W115]MDV2928284.1 endonuclease/exonuclease/phosphatase family protein [Roseovarius sp. W115]
MQRNALRLVSYNIRKARGLDQRRSPERVIEVINSLNADLVALQEADRRFGERVAAVPAEMIEAETDLKVVPVAKRKASVGWHGNAVLVRKDLEVACVEQIDLPGLEPRGAVKVTLGCENAVSIIAMHLGLRRSDRQAQLEQIKALAEPDEHVVLLGDFNEWSSHKGFAPIQDRFKIVAPGRTFHASRPMAALDRFAFSETLMFSDAGVEQGALAQRASDHLPIWADVRKVETDAIY